MSTPYGSLLNRIILNPNCPSLLNTPTLDRFLKEMLEAAAHNHMPCVVNSDTAFLPSVDTQPMGHPWVERLASLIARCDAYPQGVLKIQDDGEGVHRVKKVLHTPWPNGHTLQAVSAYNGPSAQFRMYVEWLPAYAVRPSSHLALERIAHILPFFSHLTPSRLRKVWERSVQPRLTDPLHTQQTTT